MVCVLASRLGYALRFARKDGVCDAVLEHISSALKILKAKSPVSEEATGHDDPWWNGPDPWSGAHAKSGLDEGFADCQPEDLQDITKTSGGIENGKISSSFNPDAEVFTPLLKLPSFAPAVCDVEGSLQIQLNKLSETVAALDRKVEILGTQVPAFVPPSAGEACVGDNSADAVPTLETTMDVNKLYAELIDTQQLVEKEFHEYDDVLTDMSNKLQTLESTSAALTRASEPALDKMLQYWCSRFEILEEDCHLPAVMDKGLHEMDLIESRCSDLETEVASMQDDLAPLREKVRVLYQNTMSESAPPWATSLLDRIAALEA